MRIRLDITSAEIVTGFRFRCPRFLALPLAKSSNTTTFRSLKRQRQEPLNRQKTGLKKGKGPGVRPGPFRRLTGLPGRPTAILAATPPLPMSRPRPLGLDDGSLQWLQDLGRGAPSAAGLEARRADQNAEVTPIANWTNQPDRHRGRHGSARLPTERCNLWRRQHQVRSLPVPVAILPVGGLHDAVSELG